jgi:2-oxoglutarate ferredoxin oxidoreductase subunit alpha
MEARMAVDVNITIGGEAGQGIQTVGLLLAKACHKAGLFLFAINDYESRIRGGHSFFQCRVRDRETRAPRDQVDLLCALDKNTLDLHQKRTHPKGVCLVEGEGDPSGMLFPVPVPGLAKEAGGAIYSNTVAAGALLALLGAPLDLVLEVVGVEMGKKGPEVAEKNRKAARLGHAAAGGKRLFKTLPWEKTPRPGVLADGAQALALGALAGDCRFAAFYPMSPATGVMTHLAAFSVQAPVHVEQAEDEIAAINMVTGASFAGVRSLTSTSGGGFSLMVEGLGLAGITETPVVVINAQRPGPATGMPTRTAQADLLFVINASQDEFPRFVFAPATPEEGFETMIRAFDLSDKYQTPALVLADHFFIDALVSTTAPLKAPESVKRYLTTAGPEYRRYALTPEGISPRALPGRGEGFVMVTGNEHRPDGHVSDAALNRKRMVDKRNSKIPAMRGEMRPPLTLHGEASSLIVSWGSSKGPVFEAVENLRDKGLDLGAVHFSDIWPFPEEAALKALSGKRFFCAECNSSGQFARLLRQETGLAASGLLLKYDGRPFSVEDIAVRAEKAMEGKGTC